MNEENVVEAMVMAVGGGREQPEGRGRYRFTVLPRVGEQIELMDGDQAYLFEVVAIHHPGEPASTAGDIYVRRLGPTAEVIKSLCDRERSR